MAGKRTGKANLRLSVISALTLLASVAGADQVRVSDAAQLHAAVDRALARTDAPREIVLEPGEYFLSRAIVLKGTAASNFVFRAERPGTVTLYGGVKLSGWRREEGSPFFVADVPDWRPGESPVFRSLVKNGEWAPIATCPGGTNRFSHTARFAPKLLPALAGYWSRPPTHEEYVEMPYRPDDLGDGLRLENADIRLFHMWSDSLCTVSNVDREAHVLRVAQRPSWPMGACDRRQYEVLNLREGMTPGAWYLERDSGRIHYWPKEGEDMSRLVVVAPTLRSVVSVEGDRWNVRGRVRGVRLENLTVMAAAPGPEERASFGGSAVSAALSAVGVRDLTVANVTIRNVGGAGLLVAGAEDVRVSGCDVSFVGARGAGFEDCRSSSVTGNRIADVGLVYRSSCGMTAAGSNTVFGANEICRAPYCGIIGGGSDNLYVSNLVHHVMQVLHDGAAVYGNLVRCTVRGNVVRDVVANGSGFGVHAYYADEGSRDCLFEGNRAEGVASPVHNHMTLRTTFRGNRFVGAGDMRVSFARSTDCVFSDNTLVCSGKVEVIDRDGAPHWTRNVVRRPDEERGREWTPPCPPQPVKSAAEAPRTEVAPVPDGRFAAGEWPDRWYALDRTPDRHVSGFTTANVRFAWDDACLYVSLMSACYAGSKVSEGSTWGRDDGVGLVLPNGVRIRAFLSGATDVSPSGAGIRVWAGRDPGVDPKKPWLNRNVGHYEFAVPWSAIGLQPKTGLELPFNAFAYVSELKGFKCWEGSVSAAPPAQPPASAEGTLMLK